MSRKISEGRKTAYYVGGIIMALGLLSFASTFVTFAMNFGDFTNFNSNVKSDMTRAIGGMVLMGLGAMIRNIGARGLAGSGTLLDPEKSEELEPYSRMTGGMLKDTLDEADIDLSGLGRGSNRAPEKVIMIKCRDCGQLNEEDSKFCQECGRVI